MTDLLKEEKVFKDPVHHYIYVQDSTVWNLINTREFQRLRRIRQLGTSYLTFHGAEHSRFTHSLGVYEITRRIISQFERNEYPDWPKEERLLCLCAALLHDIGHGPFSHSIEKAFGNRHEDWTCRIMLGDTEIFRILQQVSPDFPEKVASVIRKTYKNEIVVSLISSQMDADRMDYLLRDAYYTGVHYGTFDLERILRVIRPYRGRIVVKDTGMHAVEDYLVSRYQMYWQVYFHPVTRSAEIVLSKIFSRAKELFEEGYPFGFWLDPMPRLFDGSLTLEDYFKLDESFMQMAFQQWRQEADPILSDLCGRFLDRRLFKYVTLDLIDVPRLERLKQWMDEAGWDPAYYMEIDFPTDMPYHVYRPGEETETLPILLIDSKNRLIEISRKSEIVRSISRIQRGQHRLYFPEEVILARKVPDEIRQFLQQETEGNKT